MPVEIVLTLNGAPLAYVEVTALPFDANGLLDSLEAAAPVPRPAFPSLEAEMIAYRVGPAVDLGQVGRAWTATRDSAQWLADSLLSVSHEAPGYPAAYRRFQALYRRLTERAARREAALQEVTDEIRSLAVRAGAAADSIRLWELEAYAPFDSLVALRIAAEGRPAVSASSHESGAVELELAPGAWWIRAQMRYPDNPFLEYEWNTMVWVRGWWPLHMRLFEGNVAVGWRH